MECTTLVRHAPTYWVDENGQELKFAVDVQEDGSRRFFVPALSDESETFEAKIPLYEGFWKSSLSANEELPWPQPDTAWVERNSFLEAFDFAESRISLSTR